MNPNQAKVIEEVREFLAFVEEALTTGRIDKGSVVLGWNGKNPTVRSVAKQLNAKLGKLSEYKEHSDGKQ